MVDIEDDSVLPFSSQSAAVLFTIEHTSRPVQDINLLLIKNEIFPRETAASRYDHVHEHMKCHLVHLFHSS